MLFSFSGETRNHGTPKPATQPLIIRRLGIFLSVLSSAWDGLTLFHISEARRGR